MTQICEAEIALEICPTSNLLTKALEGEEALRETFRAFSGRKRTVAVRTPALVTPTCALDGVEQQIRLLVNSRAWTMLLASLPMQEALTKVSTRITERQLQVIELIAAGCSNEEVGERLGISARTAKAHSDVLRQKLGVARRRQIPVAYRLLTGDDPLSRRLGPASGPGD
jgi:ATP/maltotriose-dependent transcriptional regulator MalT